MTCSAQGTSSVWTMIPISYICGDTYHPYVLRSMCARAPTALSDHCVAATACCAAYPALSEGPIPNHAPQSNYGRPCTNGAIRFGTDVDGYSFVP